MTFVNEEIRFHSPPPSLAWFFTKAVAPPTVKALKLSVDIAPATQSCGKATFVTYGAKGVLPVHFARPCRLLILAIIQCWGGVS